MLTLDSLSLLLSKQSPTQAGLTLSQQLRDMVGIGTLGADRLDEPTRKPNKAADEEEVAVGLALMLINQARDAAEQAGKFLQKEAEAENKYWQDVVAVKQAGWAICRVPNQRHALGVKFGFSEAAADFKNNGLAPMHRGYGGSIELDLGRLGGVSEGLVVTYEKGGKIVGRSIPRQRSRDGASLEARVLEARNTIFSQELWHELMREARTLAAHDVKLEGSRLTYQVDDCSRIILELAALEPGGGGGGKNDDDNDNDKLQNNKPDDHDNSYYDNMAEAISLSLHILLSYAHRYNELMRTRPLPPHISRTRGQQAYALLRPVIARMASVRSIRACTEFIGSITKALRHAGFSSSSFTLRTAPYSVVDATTSQGPNQPAGSQSLVRNTLQPIESNINWTVLVDTRLTVRSRTFLFPVTTTFYHIVLPPSSVLGSICPPFPDGYVDTRGLFDYLRTATARVLALHFFNKLSASGPASGPVSDSGPVPDDGSATPTKWIQPPHSASIRPASNDLHELHFSVADAPFALLLSSTIPHGKHDHDADSDADADSPPASVSWKWTPLESDGESRTMEDVVDRCAASITQTDAAAPGQDRKSEHPN
ncbi:hypothetical protein E4U42_006437 [Claviceps africana]|uniref:Mediator of RNA polymerase II transcription subunit 17 n=1 Tax=Claviceps africana TaxID=83212 RepID=A0A8K0NJB2_9HYPO|nr:hypothetical protein E4U42_006437 [Claviceps africana]